MVQGIGSTQAGAMQAVNTPSADAGVGASGGALNAQKDAKESSTAPQFGDVFKKIQAQYGEKAEKPREIKKTLGKDDFLKIMVTQMKFQDPTNPFKPEQMAAEMAQFASVEQLQNVNQNIAKLAGAQQPSERLAMTGMIGKVVTLDRERFQHVEGQTEAVSFTLPRDAKEVKVSLVSDAGEVVFEKNLGEQKAGTNTVSWDGLKKGLMPAKAGTYKLHVEAKDDQEVAIKTNAQRQARVVGVSFEGNEPFFLVGDAKNQEKITMRNIVRVDSENTPISDVPAAAAPKSGPSLISFQKGVGSANLDPAKLTPEAMAALARLQEARAPEGAAPGEEKGFANGLHEYDEPAKGGEQ